MKFYLSIQVLGISLLLAGADRSVGAATVLMDVDFVTVGASVQGGGAVLGGSGDVWNGVSGSVGILTNAAGSVVGGVGLALSCQGIYADAGGTAMDAATTPLMQNYAFGYTGPATVTVGLTGLGSYVNGPFTLVLYGAGDTGGQGVALQLAGASGGNAASTLATSGASRKLSSGLGVAYNTFTGTLTNGTLTFTASANGSAFACVNGFQLQLTVQPPVITVAPAAQTNSAGSPAVFSVVAAGAGPLSYQWQANGGTGYTNLVNGGNVSGVTSNVLTIANVSTNNGLAYQVVVANSAGAVTSAPPAVLTVQTVPVITGQPLPQTVVAGSVAAFSVTALGAGPLGYQWQATNSGTGGYTNLVNGGQISGATSNVLTLVAGSNGITACRVVVANGYGSVTSSVANLTVLPFITQPNVSSPGVMGPTLVANVVGSYSSAPANLTGNIGVTPAPVTGNGDMAIIVGEPSSALRFYVGKADFFGVLRGAIMPVGSLTLSAPALNGSSYALNQNVGPATVTGNFVNGSSGLSVTSWVASAENTAVIQLNNSGSQPLTLSSQLLDGFASSAGNPATYGATNNSTWLNVSPDTVYLELGNQLHNAAGTAPFTGKIADLRLYNQALSGSTLANLDGNGVPPPLLRWATTNQGTAALVGGGASLNSSDSHGGSVVLTGDSGSELAVGDLPLPERQFTVSAWINVASTSVNGNILTAQIPYPQIYGSSLPFPFVRGLTLNLVNGVLSASLNQSGTYNGGNDEFSADSPNHFTTTASSALPANQWIQAQVTYDGNMLTIYTNGVQVGAPVTFPTGTSGMLGWNKMAIHLGDTNVLYNGCAPQGVLMQSVVGATATTNSQGALTFTIPAGGQVTIALAAVTDRNKTNYFAAAQQQSQQATPTSLTNLFLAHNAWWSNFWTKSFVQIPDQRIQNFWYASLYLMACCSTSNAPAPGIWGNFITSATPAYQGDYTLDYNYESPFFGMLTCNHTELADNYEKPLLEQTSRGTAAAQDNFGSSNTGIYFPVHLIASPGYSDDPFVFEGIKANSIFAAVNCAQRWKYTQDTNYAAKVYPYLKGVANFWNNYLVLSSGYYVDYNDASYEFAGNDTNPTMTLSFINLVYPVLIQMSQALNVDAGSRAQWANIVANLSPLPIVPASSIGSLNALGAPYNNPGVNVLRDAASGSDFYNPQVKVYQDHQLRSSGVGQGSMLAIFPGWNIGLESPSYSLLAASNTVWLTAAWYDENANNFSYPSAACIGFDPNQILTNLDTFLSLYSYNNFMVSVNGGGIEEFATVPGTLAAMFLQSYQTNVHIFADWPSNQSAAFGNLNACGGFLVSGAITLGLANYVQVQSTAGQMLKLANPWPGAAVQCVSSLTGISTLSGSVLNYQTQVGEVLTLTSTTVTNLPAPTNLVAALNGGSAVLAWNAVAGAGGYNVKRATSIGGPYLNVASGLTVTNYTDASLTGHTTYYYAVTALAPGFESTNSAVVTVIPPAIQNFSFEAQSVSAGSYAIETPTSWNVAGQSGGAVIALIHPAAGDGRFSSNPPPGLDGNNYCQLFMNGGLGSATVYQDLGSANQYQAGTTYTLTAAFGLERGNSPTGTLVLYNSALTPLATQTITPAMLTSNAFTSYSVSYTATGSEGGNGDLVVGFSTTGAAGTSFDVDNVRLTTVTPASTNATLTSLVVSPALSFTPAFSASTFSYTAVAAYGSTPTVTVADANGNATNQLSYNGATNLLASGVASAALALNANPAVTNVVQVQVTAQDGVSKQTYTVNVVQLPNQTKPVLTSGVNAGLLTLSWPLDHLGYRLLTQTNNLNLGVSANPNDWATVPGSTTTNLLALPIIQTNRNTFFRLVYP